MTSATAALQSLEAHRKVLTKEQIEMKDDIAFLRDLRRRYTLPLSELPPCKGLPAPVAASARKFLVDTEAYIMRKISANQKQDAEIANQADQLRGTIQQTAQIAHQIAGTQPTNFNPPGFYANNTNFNNGGNQNVSGVTSMNFVAQQQQPQQTQPQIGFDNVMMMAGSPGGASRYSAVNRNGGGGIPATSPMPFYPATNVAARGNGIGNTLAGAGNSNCEIGFEAPLGVLPYMTAASAAYRQQQALAYLAADQGLLPRGWQPAPLQPNSFASGSSGFGYGAGRNNAGMNVSPSRMRTLEMQGGLGGNGDGTTFVVLPRASSQEPPKKRRAASAGGKK
jgi:hypothetical protein